MKVLVIALDTQIRSALEAQFDLRTRAFLGAVTAIPISAIFHNQGYIGKGLDVIDHSWFAV